MTRVHRLVIVLGDQLTLQSPALADFDPAVDIVGMAEVADESTHVWSHKARTAYFFAAMRQFARVLRGRGFTVRYLRIGEHAHTSLAAAFTALVKDNMPQKLEWVEPGDFRVEQALLAMAKALGLPYQVHDDSHFLFSRADFLRFAGSRHLRMETFYRMLRAKLGVLMQAREPIGGEWNFDHENRQSFGKAGPGLIPEPLRFTPDDITRGAIADVEHHFATHPGKTSDFAWPVTRDQALAALADFIEHRLPDFGRHQDAMWTDAPFLNHSLISMALNVKLLDPREVIAAAEAAYHSQAAPIASVEGFIRQVLGWREFIRGVYWRDMPAMANANHLAAKTPLPRWYWTGETRMNCMRQVISQTLRFGYAHHIQRLMVTGNFALIAGLVPAEVCDWYLAVYVDAIDWVERPNTAGMALYADGGRFTSKPYAASGAYIKRMSNYCGGCAYRPELATGESACPMTTFYWAFVARHKTEFERNPRTALMVKNLDRKGASEIHEIIQHADALTRNMETL